MKMICKPPPAIILFIVLLLAYVSGEAQTEEEAETLTVSPKCAAVLISGGSIGGASIAYLLTPTALCTAGFCPAGVSASSFASWWQSTIPLVQSGIIFATLQSVAMGGAGAKVTMSGTVLGGALSKKYLTDLCAYVDDPDSKMAPLFDASLELVRAANKAVDGAKDMCSSSESCFAAMNKMHDLIKTASSSATSSFSSMWTYASKTAKSAATMAEIWRLESKIGTLNEEIEKLKRSTYTGYIYDKAKPFTWSHAFLNTFSGGTVDKIIALEEKLKAYEERLKELKK
ncbi:hypothetical protein ACHAWF_010312 [Thalassiosira exigua]